MDEKVALNAIKTGISRYISARLIRKRLPTSAKMSVVLIDLQNRAPTRLEYEHFTQPGGVSK